MRRVRTTVFTLNLVVLLLATNLLLLVFRCPGAEAADQTSPAISQSFAWNQDAYWKALEAKYTELRQRGCSGVDADVNAQLNSLKKLLAYIDDRKLGPEATEFYEMEDMLFRTAPLVSACNTGLPEYLALAADLRTAIKRRSEHWDMKSEAARTTLYRLLYGARGAVEEIMMQAPEGAFSALTRGIDEPSATPAADFRNVRFHSGDILVSRGGAPTSALIARGNDYPGNFSHIALVYVDPVTKEAKIVESHIEVGVLVSTAQQYLSDRKLRVMLLRPRTDLRQMVNDPMLPHRAAEYEYKRATEGHIPYDFEMDYKDHSKLFCSEVASEAYERYGINLWAGLSHISSPGLRRWLSAFGVTNFETQEPSDLEYDPQLRVVAEWRDPVALKSDRIDNAVTEVMLEGAEKGEEIRHQWYLLPFAGIVKGYSALLNGFGKPGPIPEGMSAATALITQHYMCRHEEIGRSLKTKAEKFKKERGYEAPYWELVRLAREAKDEI